MSYRDRKHYKVYKKHTLKTRAAGVCEFCKIKAGSDQLVEETESFKVIKNIFPYSLWDYRQVSEHMMVVPKLHTETLDDISEHQAAEYLKIISSYESRGFDVFARAPLSSQKSVPHQHTHLIKAEGRPIKGMLYLKNPYYRLTI